MSYVSVSFEEETSTLSVNWIIDNFSTVTNRVDSELFCPPGHDDMVWGLIMHFADEMVQFKLHTNYVADVTAEVRSGFVVNNNKTVISAHTEPSRKYPSKFTLLRGIKIRPALTPQEVQAFCSTGDVLRVVLKIRCFDTLAFQPVVSNKFKVTNHMLKAFREGQFTDVTLKADGQEIHAHRVAITSCDVFMAMLLSNTREGNSGVIVIQDIRYPILRALVEFLYAGEYNLTTVSFAARLLMAADKYNLMALRDICEKYIIANITCLTVVDSMIITEPLELVELNKEALKVISEYPYDEIVDMHLIGGNANLQKLVHDEMVKTIKELETKIETSIPSE